MKKPSGPKLFQWFKFYPATLAPMLTMDDADFGKRMKKFLLNLMANQGEPGTPEGDMLTESRAKAEQWKLMAQKRWAKRNGTEVEDDMGPVYEAAAEMGVSDVDAAEWHHAQREKGFTQLENWPGAMKRWSETKVLNTSK